MILYVNVDERQRIIAMANEGFHLGEDELSAEFSDDVVENGHVRIYDDHMVPLYVLVDGVAVRRSQEEIDADYVEPEVVDYEVRITALENQLAAYEAAYAEGVQNA